MPRQDHLKVQQKFSLPGTGEAPAEPIFIDGKKTETLKGKGVAERFIETMEDYIKIHYVPTI